MMKKKVSSLRDMYKQAGEMPTPRQAMVALWAGVSKRSESSVRQWLCGATQPDPAAAELLAKYYKCAVSDLFPADE